MSDLLQTVVTLAKEVGTANPIDFGNLSQDEAYQVAASQLVEQYLMTPEAQRELVTLAVATHLVVENMVLNKKLLEG